MKSKFLHAVIALIAIGPMAAQATPIAFTAASGNGDTVAGTMHTGDAV